MKRAAIAAAALTLTLAGCGSSPESSAPTTALTTTTTIGEQPPAKSPAGQIVERFKAAGIPIAEWEEYTPETDGNQLMGMPGQYVAKATWHDSRLRALDPHDPISQDSGGTVEVFANQADLEAREDWIGEEVHRVAKNLVLLRGADDLTEAQWQEYVKALGS